jgi:hypothetical protein
MNTSIAELQDLADVLGTADFQCEVVTLGRFARVLLGQNPYCVLAIVEGWTHDDLRQMISDAQAELTQLTLRAQRTSIRWDLYVLLHLRTDGGVVDPNLVEAIESDTKYARKLVRINIKRDRTSIDRALRPFLPLRSATRVEPVDPVELLRAELRKQGLDPELSDAALASFSATGTVVLT